MKNLTLAILLILIYILTPNPGFAFNQQGTFQIIVTIPVIPGVNVALDTQSSLDTPIQTEKKTEDASSENQNTEPRKPTIMEIIEQKIIEAEEIVYVTLVER